MSDCQQWVLVAMLMLTDTSISHCQWVLVAMLKQTDTTAFPFLHVVAATAEQGSSFGRSRTHE